MKMIMTLLFFVVIMLLQSCVSLDFIYRHETDYFTNISKDTTYVHTVLNAPDNKDRGVVAPSNRTVSRERVIWLADSQVTRTYPDFIRLGVLESAGLLGGNPDMSFGAGIFGMHPEFNLDQIDQFERGTANSIFAGGLYRAGITEFRLRWFNDAPNWSIGLTTFEAIVPDAEVENGLFGFGVLNVRKRFYLSEEIPYLTLTPGFGLAVYPSIYGNLSLQLEAGSIGGVNMRAYLGVAGGINPTYAPNILGNEYHDGTAVNTIIPYGGLGVSIYDFVNKPEETEEVIEEMEHSAWNFSIAKLYVLNAGVESSLFGNQTDDNPVFFTGFGIKLLSTEVALPILDHRISLGTSLLNIWQPGLLNFAFTILPIRFGYYYQPNNTSIVFHPHIEAGFYPGSLYNAGLDVMLINSDYLSTGISLGYTIGNPSIFNLIDDYIKFSTYYFGIVLNLNTGFEANQLRYYK